MLDENCPGTEAQIHLTDPEVVKSDRVTSKCRNHSPVKNTNGINRVCIRTNTVIERSYIAPNSQ